MSEDKRKPAAPIPSVGADGEQPTSIDYNEIISGDFGEINLEAKLSDEEFDEIQRRLNAMNLPGYLPTILQCKRPHCRGLHPRYKAKKTATGICSQVPGTVPADRR